MNYLVTFKAPYPMGHIHSRGRAHRLHSVIVSHAGNITLEFPFIEMDIVAVVEMEHTWSTSGADERTVTHHWEKKFKLIVSREAILSIVVWTSDEHKNWAPA